MEEGKRREARRKRDAADRYKARERNLIIDIRRDFKCQVNRLVFEISHAGLTGSAREGESEREREREKRERERSVSEETS